jgi:hypothetical protein
VKLCGGSNGFDFGIAQAYFMGYSSGNNGDTV